MCGAAMCFRTPSHNIASHRAGIWRCFSSLAGIVTYHDDFPQNQYRPSHSGCIVIPSLLWAKYRNSIGRFSADASTNQLISTAKIIQTRSLVNFEIILLADNRMLIKTLLLFYPGVRAERFPSLHREVN